jgi:hypothetical protein
VVVVVHSLPSLHDLKVRTVVVAQALKDAEAQSFSSRFTACLHPCVEATTATGTEVVGAGV